MAAWSSVPSIVSNRYIGVRTQEKLKLAVNETRIFATTLIPYETETNIQTYIKSQIGEVIRSTDRITFYIKRYSSFLITASKLYEQAGPA